VPGRYSSLTIPVHKKVLHVVWCAVGHTGALLPETLQHIMFVAVYVHRSKRIAAVALHSFLCLPDTFFKCVRIEVGDARSPHDGCSKERCYKVTARWLFLTGMRMRPWWVVHCQNSI
jgi:hypothetical protein